MKQRDKPRKASHCVWVCRVCSNSKAMFAAQPETRFHLLDQGFTVWHAMLKPERAEAQLRRLEGPGSVLTAVKAILGGGARPAASKEAKPPKKAGLGPVQRSAFRGYQAELHCRHAETEAEYLQAANERRRSREEFLRNVEVRRKEEQDRWAREEAEWANRRRGQLPQGRS
ncbi:unnamed protein product [Effrenium voratum]|uniref:Uncharacterized protein n=1 Tax=Effrenium voratum TaxID=2562239 RepID=A0AA36JQC8_9DINO|nr:unnamed protein product [Effrenium voratum]CAJ1413693.1 unnamed protein product [Effrenium voratum]